MAKKAKKGGEGWAIVGLALAVLGLAYLKTGREGQDSPLIPNSIEGKIDFVVAALNHLFGHQWVNAGLDELQAYLERAFPQVAVLVNAVYAAEQTYKFIQNAGYTKKQTALRMAPPAIR